LLTEHLDYVSTRNRTPLFAAAIGRVVAPGDTVLDLGCGVGILGALALRAGAARVVAVDRGPVATLAADVLARACAALGRGAAVEAHMAEADDLSLAAPADVVVCDHVGYFAIDYGILKLLADARGRLLRPGGRIVPAGVSLKLAPVASAEGRRKVDGWRADGVPAELHALRADAANAKYAVELAAADVLAAPQTVADIDFLTETRTVFSLETTFAAARDGTLDGLAGWFECTLAEGVTMTNSPLEEGRIGRPQAFFPIEEPIAVAAGDPLRVTMVARPHEHLFAWTVAHPASGARRRQFSAESLLLDPAARARARAESVPVPTRRARARAIVLSYCDGVRTLAEVEAAVLREHPDLLPEPGRIPSFVAAVLGEDTR
jgi:protein arginine N-methyltransferase 1